MLTGKHSHKTYATKAIVWGVFLNTERNHISSKSILIASGFKCSELYILNHESKCLTAKSMHVMGAVQLERDCLLTFVNDCALKRKVAIILNYKSTVCQVEKRILLLCGWHVVFINYSLLAIILTWI